MNLIVALVIASLVYIVQKRLYAKWWNRNLDVTISFEDTCVREGDASALTEVIYNGKFLPLPVFHVKFSTDRSFRFADTENTVVTDSYYRNDVLCAWLPEDHAAAAVSDWKAGTVWHTESEYDGAGFLYDNEFRL